MRPNICIKLFIECVACNLRSIIALQTFQTNDFYTHSKNALIVMVADEKELGVIRVLKLENWKQKLKKM